MHLKEDGTYPASAAAGLTGELITQTRRVNHDRGWGRQFELNVQPNPVVSWGMINTEIIELEESLKAEGELFVDPEQGDPYSAAELEVSDIIIRALDFAGLLEAYGARIPELQWTAPAARANLKLSKADLYDLARIGILSVQLCRKDTNPQLHVPQVMAVAQASIDLLASVGVDPVAITEHKLGVNKGRSWMHGRNY